MSVTLPPLFDKSLQAVSLFPQQLREPWPQAELTA